MNLKSKFLLIIVTRESSIIGRMKNSLSPLYIVIDARHE